MKAMDCIDQIADLRKASAGLRLVNKKKSRNRGTTEPGFVFKVPYNIAILAIRINIGSVFTLISIQTIDCKGVTEPS